MLLNTGLEAFTEALKLFCCHVYPEKKIKTVLKKKCLSNYIMFQSTKTCLLKMLIFFLANSGCVTFKINTAFYRSPG